MSTATNPVPRWGFLRGGLGILLLVIVVCLLGGVLVGRLAFAFSGSGPSAGGWWNWFLDRSSLFSVILFCVCGFVGGQLQYRRGRRDEAAKKDWPVVQFFR